MKTKDIITMKSFFLPGLFAFALLLVATGCRNKPLTKTFPVEYTFQVSVPPNTFINLPTELFGMEQESNSESQYEINDTRKDMVTEVFLREFFLEIQSPANADFGFMKSATFFIDAEGEPEKKIAEKDPVPENVGDEIEFEVFPENIAEYIKQEPFEIRAQVVTREQNSERIEIRGTARFDVTAKVINL